MTQRPPALGSRILSLLFDPPERDEVAGDLLEVMQRVAERHGPRRAKLRYLTEVSMLVFWRLRDMRGRKKRRPAVNHRRNDMSLEPLLRDFRFAVRNLKRSPLFAAVASATLALGIGATVTLFSIVHGVLLKPLEFGAPEELVLLRTHWGDRAFDHLSQPDILDIREQSRSLDALEIWQQQQATVTDSDGRPHRVDGAAVTNGFFSVLGVSPAVGRFFGQTEGAAAIEPVVVLGHGLWQRLYGGDPSVVGSDIDLSGDRLTVIGVAPAGFVDPATMGVDYGGDVEYWTLQPWVSNGNRSWRGFLGFGRLAPGSSLEGAATEIGAISAALAAEYPQSNANHSVAVLSLHDRIVSEIRPALWMLFGAVGLVLLIACANVANLLLTRAAGRNRELAVRTALGAARSRLVRLLLVESLVLATAGGTLGTLLGVAGVKALPLLVGDRIPRAATIEIDGTVLIFAVLAALLTSVLFGLLPALRASNPNLVRDLKEGAKGTVGASHLRLRHGLVAGEIALAIVLLVGAGLLLKSFARMQSVHVGVDRDRVLTFQMTPGVEDYPDGAALTRVYSEVVRGLEELSGILSAGAASNIPLTGAGNSVSIRRSDDPPPDPGMSIATLTRTAVPGFFEAMATPIVGGRSFEWSDDSAAVPVAIINEAAVLRFFPDESPLGRRIRLLGGDRTVVGVVADVKQDGPTEDVEITTYIPYDQTRQGWLQRRGMEVAVRTAGAPAGMAASIRELVWSINDNIPMRGFKTTATLYRETTWAPRFRTIVLSGFASLALLLAAVGIAGAVSYSVSLRRREIGIRRALGAPTGSVLGLVVGESLKLTGIGAVLGLLVSLAMVRLVSGFLFGVAPLDITVFAGIPLLLAGVALLASFVPATVAARIEPAVTLREE